MHLIYKNIGETPLEALERFRAEQVALGHTEFENAPMTYAGRLDPMAEGKQIILIGEECKNKEKYLGLDKEYEVEIVFGIETDTHDALGVATVRDSKVRPWNLDLQKYVDTFHQEYPAYSSRTVNGTQLHSLARAGNVPDEMPTKEVTIYSIEGLGTSKITVGELKTSILERIAKVKGDFRQEEIVKRWGEVLSDPLKEYDVLKVRVKCSSGTYMRSLAHRMGQDRDDGAFALSIRRTAISIDL